MTDTHSANSRQRQLGDPIACAIIFLSWSRRGQFPFARCEAGHSNRMMAAERSLLHLRVSLFLISFLAIPGILLSSTLDDAAAKLASEISSKLPAGVQASCKFVNLSSLPALDAARLDQSFRDALRLV